MKNRRDLSHEKGAFDIVCPLIPGEGKGLIRVTIRSPKRLRKAVYLCAAYFRREFHYDFVEYGFDGDEDDPDHVAFLWVPSGTGLPFSLHLLAVVGIVMLRTSAPLSWAAALNYAAFVFLWIVLPTAKTSISSVLTLLASLGSILFATIIVFKLLFKDAPITGAMGS